ncbi:MAG: ParA family protein [Planctomycetota bacterium]|nr:ParA family protein [Planctomycetota bacterium]
MRTVAIVNQKGGCGKTTTTVNLGSALASQGQRVLLVDMDPQSHCAACLGVPDGKLEWGIGEVMIEGPGSRKISDGLLWNVMRNLALAPSTSGLARLESPTSPIATAPDRDKRLSRVLEVLAPQFEWCLIDCPPNIGLLTFNAVRAADEILIPVETGYLALQGSKRQEITIESASRYMGRTLPIRIVPSMHRVASRLANEVLAALSRAYGDRVVPVTIREHELLREAASLGQSILEYAAQSEAAADFLRLAHWLTANPVVMQHTAQSGGANAWLIGDEAPESRAEVETDLPSPWGIHGGQPTRAAGQYNARMAEVISRLREIGPSNGQGEGA